MWEWRAIQIYECASVATAAIVDRTRNQRLSSAGLTQQENCGIARCDCVNQFEDLLECWAVPNDLLETQLAMAVFRSVGVDELSWVAAKTGVRKAVRYCAIH
jgi:hypothetical protein